MTAERVTEVQGPPLIAVAEQGKVGLGELGLWRAITPLGRGVAVVGVVAWIAAWRFNWVELAVLGAACIMAFVIGVVFLLVGRANLAVLLELGTPRVVAGNTATTRVETTNEANRRMLPLRLEARVGKGTAQVHVPALAANATHDEIFSIPTTRRSVVPVGPVRSVQGDPLGLVRREVIYTGTEMLFVHPKTVSVNPLTTGWLRDLEGETTNDRSPSDVAFHALREYVVGDDRRHIHWRTTARQPEGKLMVREFVDTRRAHLALLLSLRHDDYASDDEFELAVSALASLGLRSIGDEQDLSCIAGGRVLPSFHGTGFLDALAGLERGSDNVDAAQMVARARDAVAGASVAALVVGASADGKVVRLAAERLGTRVKSMIVRADLGATSAFHAGVRTPVLEVGALEDFPRLVWAVTTT